MISISSAALNAWIAGLLWPLSRILGLIATAPLFNNQKIPARARICLGILLALIVAPAVPTQPATDPMSLAGLLILMQQMVIGLAMGMAMRIVFAAVEMAGEIIGMTMGLGFATFYDPQSAGHSSAISQFLSLVMLMLYLAANFHLMLISVLVDSFTTMPIGAGSLGGGMEQLVSWGGRIFSAGVQLSLPVVAALLINNIALGVLTRAAPQLNIFGIGFPLAIGVGFVMIALTLPYLAVPVERLLQEGIDMAGQLAAPR
ncbi:flagellar biosynthetic protein FliR [Noviherbaspirillum sedimenti]|uniref:Flagellar biosynthetic protein FliR n=1 Tax=Noviherbaspirillum sedimenti TaxID=2320865 RepID=A0A3A3FZS9_9BURK|nr:flagellar biosynthetic protein FliR [Noviherbaspirillum sedimenti]RJG01171.1 flagellar biosynthetic protein FliR [Noviherbaspirillum sedimenti]